MLLDVSSIGAISFGLGALLFGALSVLLVTAWRGRRQGGLLVTATVLSFAWCVVLLLGYLGVGSKTAYAAILMEIGRGGLWCIFLAGLLGWRRSADRAGFVRVALGASLVLCALLLAQVLFRGAVHAGSYSATELVGFVLLAITGLVWVEQVFRNTPEEERWALKPLCLGVGALFAYDFFMYSEAMLFGTVDPAIALARGAVNALVVPFLAVSAARNPQWSLEIFVSRHMVFHSAVVMGAGLYLLGMAAAGYYIRAYGGTWGGVVQMVFFCGAVLLLLCLFFSGQMRSRAKTYLSKHFFKNKYDYREEWLRFTRTLSTSRTDAELCENIVRGIGQIVESSGGVMWVRQSSGFFSPSTQWNVRAPEGVLFRVDDPLPRFLDAREWIVSLSEYRETPESYVGLTLPPWFASQRADAIIIPLKERDDLLGFIVLSDSPRHLSWEDLDLLKTVGRQAASYLALLEATDALSSSRQFEAFNRLSAFVVHDLKNLVAQLSLVTANAKRFLDNPDFVADAMDTVENVTARMNRMLSQLRKDRLEDTNTKMINVGRLVSKVIERRSYDALPVPVLSRLDQGAIIQADPERFTAILEHLVQNAQEATPGDGRIELRVLREQEGVCVEVEDSGCGMDARFVSERLFRPFDTTKGNAGMGVGVYESREFARGTGGELEVESKVGRGSVFRLRFPDAGTNADDTLASAETHLSTEKEAV